MKFNDVNKLLKKQAGLKLDKEEAMLSIKKMEKRSQYQYLIMVAKI